MKRLLGLALCACLMTLAVPSVSRAQTIDYGAFEALFGEPVTTSATGQPQRVSDVPVKMDIVTADDIRRSGAKSIPDVLRSVAGMSVWQWTATQQDVSVRGYNQAMSPRLLVLINGRQVYLDFYGFTNWAALPVELSEIRQIEIVKGPNTALFGFNAVGGVINIITYNPLYDHVADVGGSVGTNEYWQTHFVDTVKLGDRAGLRMAVGNSASDQFTVPPGSSATANPWLHEVNIDGVAQVTDNSQVRIELSNSYEREGEEYFLYLSDSANYLLQSVKATYAASTGLGQMQFTLYRNWAIVDPNPLAGTPVTVRNQVTVAQAEDVFQTGNDHHFRLGLEYRRNQMEGNLIAVPGTSINYNDYAASGTWQWDLKKNLTWTNALRDDTLYLWRDGVLPPNPFYASNAAFDRNLSALSYNSSLVWRATPADSFRLSTARGVQAPSLSEFGAFDSLFPPFALGNPKINPTIVTNYEVDYDRKVDAIGGTASTGIFYQTTDNLKALGVTTVFPFTQAANIGSSRTAGIETTVKGKFRDNWTWDANYTFQRVFDDLPVNSGGPPFPVGYDSEDASPVNTANLHVGYAQGPWETDLFGHYVSDYKVLQNNFVAYSLVDINNYISINGRVGYKVTDKITAALSGQELNHPSVLQTSSGVKDQRQVFLSLSSTF